MNRPKSYSNEKVQALLSGYLTVSSLCEEWPSLDDVFTGVLNLKTSRSTSTRSLSRRTLFHILQSCSSIDIESINRATDGSLAYSTRASYAALARVASRAIEDYLSAERRSAPSAGFWNGPPLDDQISNLLGETERVGP